MMSSEPMHELGSSQGTFYPSFVRGAWRSIGLALVCLTVSPAFAAEPVRETAARTRLNFAPAQPVTGTLFISGGGRLPESSLQRFAEYGGGDDCRLVVITTASETADNPEIEPRIAPFRNLKVQDLCFLHTRDRETADSEAFCVPLETATAVWFIGGHQSRLTETYLDTRAERCFRKVLERGGVIGGTSAGAAIMSEVMIKGGNPEPELDRGFGFLRGTVVDQHFLKRHRQDRLMNALSAYPELVGLGIDEGTTLVVQGRTMTVLDESDSQVMTCLAGAGEKPHRTELLSQGQEVDLLALARSANKRLNPRENTPPSISRGGLPSGTLVVVGGGEIPRDAAERFVSASGGSQALIIVITTAYGEQPPEDGDTVRWLKEAGAENTLSLHIRDQHEANDPKTLDLLREAGGVWFTGGRQWRIIDALEETQAEVALHEVLARDGAIGGNAAGASVLASYLVRGNPINNRQIMGEGYEDGLAFLPGTAIDPFFTQRNRKGDMAHLKRLHPKLIGLGIDESTAVVVRGRELAVYGYNRVAVFDKIDSDQQSEEDFEPLLGGDRYDLIERSRVGTIDENDSRRFVVASDEAADDETPEPSSPLVCE